MERTFSYLVLQIFAAYTQIRMVLGKHTNSARRACVRAILFMTSRAISAQMPLFQFVIVTFCGFLQSHHWVHWQSGVSR